MDFDVLAPSFQGGILVDSDMLDIRVEMANKKLWKFLSDKILSTNCGMIFKVNHPLHEPFNAKITQMISGGITNQILEPYQKGRFKNLETDQAEPKVLTMTHLMIGFEIWLFFLYLAIGAFLLECLFYSVKRIILAVRKL